MANHRIADDIGVGIATVHGWRKQLEPEGLVIRKVEPGEEHSSEQIFTILPETASPIQCSILSQYHQLLILNKMVLYFCYQNIITSNNVGRFTLKQPVTLKIILRRYYSLVDVREWACSLCYNGGIRRKCTECPPNLA
ncbi:hypothetical protein ACU608_24325 [Klebsiella aerogenes]